MSSTVTKALRGLYKKMTDNEAAGNSTVKVLNEIATAMGASTTHTSVTQCIDEITANYSASGSSDFTTAEVTVTLPETAKLYMPFASDEYSDTESEIISSGTYTAILYKGTCFAVVSGNYGSTSASGNIEANESDITITGDGTITVSMETYQDL